MNEKRNKTSTALCDNLTHSVNLSLGFITRKVSYVTIFCYHLLNILVKKDEKISRKDKIFGSSSIYLTTGQVNRNFYGM